MNASADRALHLRTDDDVAVAIANLVTGHDVLGVRMVTDVAAGHKVALHDIAAGGDVCKYGQVNPALVVTTDLLGDREGPSVRPSHGWSAGRRSEDRGGFAGDLALVAASLGAEIEVPPSLSLSRNG